MSRTGTPDVAVIDAQLQGLSGIETARGLYDEFAVPSVLLVGAAHGALVVEAVDAGVYAILLKPSSPEQVRAAIEVAFQLGRAHVEMESEIESLERRLTDRKVIEQAKWVLVSQQGMTEPDAAQHINRSARNARRTAADVAMEILTKAGVTPR